MRDRFNGIQISFPEPGEKKDVVSLRGPKDDVEQCAAHLKKMGADLVSRASSRKIPRRGAKLDREKKFFWRGQSQAGEIQKRGRMPCSPK